MSFAYEHLIANNHVLVKTSRDFSKSGFMHIMIAMDHASVVRMGRNQGDGTRNVLDAWGRKEPY